MNLSDIKTNPTFENLLPPLTDEEFLGLEKDIVKRRKILNPILVWSKGNFIIDGHNRYKILIAHKMDTDNIITMDFDTESEVMAWIVESQFAKRNLTRSQKIILLQKVEEQVRREAEERQKRGDNQYTKSLGSNLTQPSNSTDTGRTAEIMAAKLNISKNTYKDMKTIVESNDAEKIARMDKGGRGNGVSTIAREIREGVPNNKRICTKCGKAKDISEFKKCGNGEIRNICKECYNAEQREKSKMRREHQGDQKTALKAPFSNSFAPASYYDVNRQMNWTYEEVKGEFDFIFKDSLAKLKSIFKNHIVDVFSENDNILAFANEVQLYASQIKFLEREIRNNAANYEEAEPV